jgi:hypothetical protein
MDRSFNAKSSEDQFVPCMLNWRQAELHDELLAAGIPLQLFSLTWSRECNWIILQVQEMERAFHY